ncbi:LytR/AlgR family response regulator transcription factor [Ochrovirga pacifica]|uniref:LytR/AlgR family response regulator transcription factor n=1 Tax=Ochrovirga pacifica TaxID=1042376 RepID=UPI000255776B|nr:LytTR family DNA-binding domain-containing protein [Ochrovirga pacifica]
MNCIIIEDQLPAQRILKKYLNDYGQISLVATFTDAITAIDFLKNNAVDLIFLDIHLPKISGLDFLKSLRHPPRVILTTAFPDYALDGYELNVLDYLLKPFSFQRFVKAVQKLPKEDIKLENDKGSDEMFLKSGYEYIRIQISNILYIKSDTDYTLFVFKNQNILSSEPLRFWENEFVHHNFVRVHKSYLINLKQIVKANKNYLYLQHQHQIPIGRSYKDAFFKLLN